jgi:hypothetical protein
MSIALNDAGVRKESPMGKLNDDNAFHGQRTSRSLLAITLAAAVAAFGCSTNHNLGNGAPTRSGPEVRTAPTSGVTSGGETAAVPPGRTIVPPMMSSYTRSETLPSVTPRSIRRSPDEAAAIMAGHQITRGRYLGLVSPGASGRGYESANVSTYVNPALQTNPQRTMNSSISSQPTPGITSGAEGTVDAGGLFATLPTVTAASGSAAVRLVRGTSGSVTMTNVGVSSTASTTGRNP